MGWVAGFITPALPLASRMTLSKTLPYYALSFFIKKKNVGIIDTYFLWWRRADELIAVKYLTEYMVPSKPYINLIT